MLQIKPLEKAADDDEDDDIYLHDTSYSSIDDNERRKTRDIYEPVYSEQLGEVEDVDRVCAVALFSQDTKSV